MWYKFRRYNNYMRQIILIGFSTTGKSTFIKKNKDRLANRRTIDTDKVISKDFGESISKIYYSFRHLEDAYRLINEKEIEVIKSLTQLGDNIIIAAGPGIPSKLEFVNYIHIKKPHVVLIQRPTEEIYYSLLDRRNKMKVEVEHQRLDFGKWDVGVIVDENLSEYPKDIAISKIQALLDERESDYNRFATLKLKSNDIFSGNLPQALLDIL
jgi:shikimate kinase